MKNSSEIYHIATLPEPRAEFRASMERMASELAAFEACKTGDGSDDCSALTLAHRERDDALALVGTLVLLMLGDK